MGFLRAQLRVPPLAWVFSTKRACDGTTNEPVGQNDGGGVPDFINAGFETVWAFLWPQADGHVPRGAICQLSAVRSRNGTQPLREELEIVLR